MVQILPHNSITTNATERQRVDSIRLQAADKFNFLPEDPLGQVFQLALETMYMPHVQVAHGEHSALIPTWMTADDYAIMLDVLYHIASTIGDIGNHGIAEIPATFSPQFYTSQQPQIAMIIELFILALRHNSALSTVYRSGAEHLAPSSTRKLIDRLCSIPTKDTIMTNVERNTQITTDQAFDIVNTVWPIFSPAHLSDPSLVYMAVKCLFTDAYPKDTYPVEDRKDALYIPADWYADKLANAYLILGAMLQSATSGSIEWVEGMNGTVDPADAEFMHKAVSLYAQLLGEFNQYRGGEVVWTESSVDTLMQNLVGENASVVREAALKRLHETFAAGGRFNLRRVYDREIKRTTAEQPRTSFGRHNDPDAPRDFNNVIPQPAKVVPETLYTILALAEQDRTNAPALLEAAAAILQTAAYNLTNGEFGE